MPHYHDLSYKGRIIRMEIVNKSSGSIADGIYMAWEIKRIYIPQSIWEERDMVLQVVKEAFGVYRASHDEEDIKSVSVEVNCEPECVEADYNGR